MLRLTAKLPPKEAVLVEMNGEAVHFSIKRWVYSLFQLELDEGGQVTAVNIIRNPEKLRRFA
ncbi:MAG: hypothetical protein ABIP13_08995 [Tepidiformaceae bacterium]